MTAFGLPTLQATDQKPILRVDATNFVTGARLLRLGCDGEGPILSSRVDPLGLPDHSSNRHQVRFLFGGACPVHSSGDPAEPSRGVAEGDALS